MLKRIVITLSILGVLYIPLRMLITTSSLKEIQGTIKEVRPSSTRIPYYTFTLNEYPCSFYNKGNGTLSLLKDAPETQKKAVSLMIKNNDTSLLQHKTSVFYFAFNQKNKLIDVYYSIVRLGVLPHFITLFFYFLILLFNILGAYLLPKQDIFSKFIKLYLLMILLLMFL
ncbi:hypothetical protein SAMN05421786_11452 [Chryseobacterium ureilyticum]|uniref:Uncharacterized protein n=1 Tax=Chryseobacterium ureilyticum TaxID=373668 RepID=A0A1N7QQE4_9FLAO|nr:hypothetical protein [Chryseobacterium ureilyticum]SIT25112.1 hypothetical protein SAMN05421786_11452 [Chryseobacterium ureilyticum]